MQKSKQALASYIRSFTFGVEDSLVSTVGLLSGIEVAGTSHTIILFTGVIYIFVEAFSMAVGSFLSELSSEEYVAGNIKIRNGRSIIDAVIMFLSFVVAGLIPLLPYLLASEKTAFVWSVSLSLIALFVLGLIDAKFTRVKMIKKGFLMFIIGGVAIAVGVIIGRFFHV